MHRIRKTISTSVFLFIIIPLTLIAAVARGEEKWAILIGVGKYKDQNIPPLKSPENDVQTMKKILTEWGEFKDDHVFSLIDATATYDAIIGALSNLMGKVQKEDLVLFYFSGRGTRLKNTLFFDPEPDDLDECLLPYDAHYDVETKSKENFLRDDDIGRYLYALNAKRTVIIIDSSYSGKQKIEKGISLLDADGISPLSLNGITQNDYLPVKTVVIEACRPDETIGDGVFAPLLQEAFEGNADSDKDGEITIEEAFNFVRGRMRSQNRNPQLGGQEYAEGIVLVKFQLEIQSNPSGAEIILNGKLLENQPTPQILTLSKGSHEIEIKKEGYNSEHRTVEISMPGKQAIDVELKPIIIERATYIPIWLLVAAPILLLSLSTALFSYFFIARPYQIPLLSSFLILTPQRRRDYLQYFEKIWENGTPLEQLVTLIVQNDSFRAEDIHQILNNKGAFVSQAKLTETLNSLCHSSVLLREGEVYKFINPTFPKIARRSRNEKVKSKDLLIAEVRRQNSIYQNTVRFFEKSGFKIYEAAPFEFSLASDNPIYQKYGEIYAKIYAERSTHEDIREVYEIAQKKYGGNVDGKISFIITNAMEDGAYLQIYTYRSGDNFTIIPFSHDAINQSIIEDNCLRELNNNVQQFIGEVNLYSIKTPVTDPLTFFGRKKEIQQIMSYIEQKQHIGLWGIRKIGKTSLIHQLIHQFRNIPSAAVAYIDLQFQSHNCDMLYAEIIKEFQQDIRLKHPNIELPPLSLLAEDASTKSADEVDDLQRQNFSNDLLILRDTLQKKIGNPQFIFFMDEAELILPALNYPGFTGYYEFLESLRGISQRYEFLSCIFVSVDANISQSTHWENRSNPMLQFFTDIYLPPFDEEETRRMVTNLGAQMGLKYTDESLKLIYHESGGHPHLARQLCSLAAEDSRPWPADIDSDKIESAVNEYVSGRNPDLQDIWACLSLLEKKIITVLSEYNECSLNDVIASIMRTFERGEITDSLSDLERKHIVRKQDNRYTIAFPIFRKWIQFFKPKV